MASYRKTVALRDSGQLELAAGSSDGTVLASWDDIPGRVQLTVEAPKGGDVLFAVLEEARDDGFDFSLSGNTPAAGYKLHYICDF